MSAVLKLPQHGLAFDPLTHTYTLDGLPIVSVTQVLKPLFDFSKILPSVLERKRQIGVALAAATHLADIGELDEASVAPEIAGYLVAHRKFMAETGWTMVASEQAVHSPAHRVAGTFDKLLRKPNGQLVLVDEKSVHTMHPAYALQTSAYQGLWNETKAERITERYGLQLKPDGTYKLHPYVSPSDYAVFLAHVTTHYWRKQHAID